MKTKTITHEVTFCASPKEVYEALIDSKKHSEYTNAAAEIDRKVGGKFAVYEGITGEITS